LRNVLFCGTVIILNHLRRVCFDKINENVSNSNIEFVFWIIFYQTIGETQVDVVKID
jgi:hypothetical protein